MKIISDLMLGIVERLAEMFPTQSYQSNLERYLSTKGIKDNASLEHYIKQFESRKEHYL